jgi:hypothetical protein
MKTHNPRVVEAFWDAHGIPHPTPEFKFHPDRKWRFDYAWEFNCGPALGLDDGDIMIPFIALEVQGGVFVQGRHSRGAAMLKEWEKLNAAAELGWRVIYCQPKDLLTTANANLIKRCLGIA